MAESQPQTHFNYIFNYHKIIRLSGIQKILFFRIFSGFYFSNVILIGWSSYKSARGKKNYCLIKMLSFRVQNRMMFITFPLSSLQWINLFQCENSIIDRTINRQKEREKNMQTTNQLEYITTLWRHEERVNIHKKKNIHNIQQISDSNIELIWTCRVSPLNK